MTSPQIMSCVSMLEDYNQKLSKYFIEFYADAHHNLDKIHLCIANMANISQAMNLMIEAIERDNNEH